MKTYHSVTAKIAIFNPEHARVIVVEYQPGGSFGLPGGHVETDEEPLQAVIREVEEEIGIALTPDDITIADSWLHPDKKIIIAYTTTFPTNGEFRIDPSELQSANWVSVDDIRDEVIDIGTYRDFVLNLAGKAFSLS